MATTPDTTGPGRHLLSVEEAARALSIGRTTMFHLIRTGQITTVRIGRLRRIPATALTDFTRHLTTAHQAA